MNATERAKRSDELHYDNIPRRALCDRIANLESDIEDARTKADELRELVSDMMRFFEDGDWCDKCNHARECDSQEQYEGDCLMRLVFRDRMRELGVKL